MCASPSLKLAICCCVRVCDERDEPIMKMSETREKCRRCGCHTNLPAAAAIPSNEKLLSIWNQASGIRLDFPWRTKSSSIEGISPSAHEPYQSVALFYLPIDLSRENKVGM